MNQTELAEALDVSLATVSRICSGERRPSLDLMYRIEEVLIWSIEAQAAYLRGGLYPQVFTQKMERRQARRRDVDPSAMRSVSEAGPGSDGVPALEAGSEERQEGGVGERSGPIRWLDTSGRWCPR